MQYSVADGSEKVSKASPLSLNDTLTRSRVRPTAYVIPADTANIEKILYIMDNQGAEYYKLNAGYHRKPPAVLLCRRLHGERQGQGH